MKRFIIILTVLISGMLVPVSGSADTGSDASGPCLRAGCYTLAPGLTGGLAQSGFDSLRSPESFVTRWPVLRTTVEILTFNAIMTLFGRYVMDPPENGFHVSVHTIKENLKAGMEWDDNSFNANNFRHPYQGSLYFGAARANGYDYYQSIYFSFAGSWLFEYAGEAHHPSFNDWLNTAVGGIVIGESLFRLSSLVLDNTATGTGRFFRELGGFGISPLRGLNRLFTGEAWTVHANPPDRGPDHIGVDLEAGVRTIGDDNLTNAEKGKAFFKFLFDYGDPFVEGLEKPFDYFDFGMQLNGNNKPRGVGWIGTKGTIIGCDVSKSETVHHFVAAYQHLDYWDNEAFTYGGQSVSASFLSRFMTGSRYELRTELHLNFILLGASRSDYFNISGREYDYGPGAGFKFKAVFNQNGRDVLTLANEQSYIHSVNGNQADHFVNITRVKLDFKLKNNLGLGLEYLLYLTRRAYKEFPDVDARSPEIRGYVSWNTR
jgi:hypothetical protein